MASPTKHDRLSVAADLMCGERDLLGAIDTNKPMGHPGHVGFAFANLVGDWIALIAIGEDLHLFAEGGREEDGLAIVVGLIEDLLNDRQETHVGHAVSLVHHRNADLVELHLALVDEIEEAARTGDQHVDSTSQCLELGAEAHAAVHGCDLAAANMCERLELTTDLLGKLTGRREYETGWLVRLCILQPNHHRNAKGEGLSRPGRCTTQHVLACESIGNGR